MRILIWKAITSSKATNSWCDPTPLPKLIKSLTIDLSIHLESRANVQLTYQSYRYLRNSNLRDVVENLLSNHDSGYLNGQLQEATLLTAAIQSILTQHSSVPSWWTNDHFWFEECDVEDRGVIVDELE